MSLRKVDRKLNFSFHVSHFLKKPNKKFRTVSKVVFTLIWMNHSRTFEKLHESATEKVSCF